MRLGADVAAVDSLSRVVNDESQRLQGSLRTVDSMVTTVWWQGADADHFRGAWSGDLRAKGSRAAEALALLARHLAGQADEQRRASDPDATTSSGFGLPATTPVLPGTRTIASSSGFHGSVDGMVGVDSGLSSKVEYKDGQVTVGASGEVTIGAKGEVSAGYTAGPLDVSGTASTMVGAEGSVSGSVGAGKDGVHAHAGAEAFAGGKIDGEVKAEAGGVSASAKGGLSYGIGAHADFDATLSSEEVGVSVDTGLTFGVGGEGKVSVKAKPAETWETIKDGGGAVGGWIVDHARPHWPPWK